MGFHIFYYMERLFSYNQIKSSKKFNQASSSCEIILERNSDYIFYNSEFIFEYQRYGEKKNITHKHYFSININNGDVHTTYHLIPNKINVKEFYKTLVSDKKNNFDSLSVCIEDGLLEGEKRKGYWGVKYDRSIDKIYEIINDILRPNFKSEFYKDKDHKNKYSNNGFYDLIVDYHLDMKGIKGHDRIYIDIMNEYPKRKWLLKNENKFLPSVLDSYGIKSKYLVSELNQNTDIVYIKSLDFLCKLFGENYLEYIKEFNWKRHCYAIPYNKKTFELKNESEKKAMVSLINKWEHSQIMGDSLIHSVKKLLDTRFFLESMGFDLKFKCKSYDTFLHTLESWSAMKKHLKRGYKLKYDLPEYFTKKIEEPIIIDNQRFVPKILTTEEEFILEGHKMKNCMPQQFIHGLLYIYVSLHCGKKRIDLQFRKGDLSQMYGKANTPVDDIFLPAAHILSNRFEKEPNIEWKRIKYDIIKKK